MAKMNTNTSKTIPADLVGQVSEADWQIYCRVSHLRYSALGHRLGASGAGGRVKGPSKARSFAHCSKAGAKGGPLGAQKTNALRRQQKANRRAALEALGVQLAKEGAGA